MGEQNRYNPVPLHCLLQILCCAIPMLQLTIDYVPTEDRLLLKIGMGEEEAQFWLTRKALKMLWPILGQASLHLVSNPTLPANLRHEVAEMQRQAMTRELDYATPYKVERKIVWAGGPQLVTQVDLRQMDDGTLQLQLTAVNGGCVNLGLNLHIQAGLTDMLQKAVAGTDWDLSLDVKPTLSPAVTEKAFMH